MEGVRATEFAPAAKYCNFSRLSRYLDPHMSIGVIESFYFTLCVSGVVAAPAAQTGSAAARLTAAGRKLPSALRARLPFPRPPCLARGMLTRPRPPPPLPRTLHTLLLFSKRRGIYDEKSLLNTLLELTSRTKLAQNKNKYLQLRAQLPSANVGADAETPESILESTLEELKRESAALEAAMGPLIDIVGVNVSVSYEFVTGESLVRDVRVEPPQLKQ